MNLKKMALGVLLIATEMVGYAKPNQHFSVTSYNIKNLPSVRIFPAVKLFPKRRKNLLKMIPKLCHLDILLLQEDFWYRTPNALRTCFNYQDAARKSAQQNMMPTISIWTFLNQLRKEQLNDGLSEYSRYPILKSTRIQWNNCMGNIRFANDCFAQKGFHFSRVLVNDEMIDIYNLHSDAGYDWKSTKTRSMQFKQLELFVKRYSPYQKLVIAGDFNTTYDDKTLVALKESLGLMDSCEKTACAGDNIDKILYRSFGHFIPMEYETLQDLQGLSDHDAIRVKFRLRDI